LPYVFGKWWALHYDYCLLAGKIPLLILVEYSIVEVVILFPGRMPDLGIALGKKCEDTKKIAKLYQLLRCQCRDTLVGKE
jgi:hypothetical protein